MVYRDELLRITKTPKAHLNHLINIGKSPCKRPSKGWHYLAGLHACVRTYQVHTRKLKLQFATIHYAHVHAHDLQNVHALCVEGVSRWPPIYWLAQAALLVVASVHRWCRNHAWLGMRESITKSLHRSTIAARASAYTR